MQLVAITDDAGKILEADWLARAEAVHRQLRPQLPADYSDKMRRVFDGGGRMLVATEDKDVAGVAVYRIYQDTYSGIKCYVDDLVTDESRRSGGVGHAMIEWLVEQARHAGCGALRLDSGSQRTQAHKFYFREGFVIPSFHFNKPIK
ncbi:MAG: GNAT family N-acetyltransferase [Proteobacteria bacterium]|nr:GNAT family N-acetyltransferase [Pseudomonadota bacterium]